MNEKNSLDKKKQFQEKLKSFTKAFGIGLLEGSIAAGLGWSLLKINIYAMFGVFAIWLVFGWFSTYIIQIKTIEILTLVITASIVSGLIYYFTDIQLWFISLLVGLAILFWTISFTTKIFLYTPIKNVEKQPKSDY
ncbi:MAG: hypothetical protein HZR80_05375 [Candidatus Heimdallarchaeota archaeon]